MTLDVRLGQNAKSVAAGAMSAIRPKSDMPNASGDF